jgi:DNA-directed RNA polymerase subunit RPC12/RpoP
MSSETNNVPSGKMFLHKCPNCNATLEFDIRSGNVICSYCGSSYDVETLLTENGRPEQGTASQSSQAAQNAQTAQENADAPLREFDWGAYKKHLKREDLSGTKSYLCQTCGAEVILDTITASAQCPYCGNFLILTENVMAGLRPNGIIPFKILPEKLSDSVKNFYKNKKLLPFHFFDKNRMEKVRGLYVPFWLYDCSLSGGITFLGDKVSSFRSGDYICTETSEYKLFRSGDMTFARIPVDASIKMPNDLMDSIEPFDYSQLTEFNSGYLTGFIADRFDSDPDENLPRMTTRVGNSAVEILRQNIQGYSNVRVSENGLNMSDSSVKYVMLPVYLFDCTYAGKTYHYAANGQTGKVVGELPVSKGKKWLYFGIPFLIVFALIFAFLMMLS